MQRMFSVEKSMSVRKFNFGSLATLNFESSVTKPALTRIWPEMARPVLKRKIFERNLDRFSNECVEGGEVFTFCSLGIGHSDSINSIERHH